jgi:hypothetical protein
MHLLYKLHAEKFEINPMFLIPESKKYELILKKKKRRSGGRTIMSNLDFEFAEEEVKAIVKDIKENLKRIEKITEREQIRLNYLSPYAYDPTENRIAVSAVRSCLLPSPNTLTFQNTAKGYVKNMEKKSRIH